MELPYAYLAVAPLAFVFFKIYSRPPRQINEQRLKKLCVAFGRNMAALSKNNEGVASIVESDVLLIKLTSIWTEKNCIAYLTDLEKEMLTEFLDRRKPIADYLKHKYKLELSAGERIRFGGRMT